MIDISVLERMDVLVPLGDRSELVNGLLEEKMTDLSRKKASEILRAFREKRGKKMGDKDILKFIHESRKGLL